jgi:hypothetical protein
MPGGGLVIIKSSNQSVTSALGCWKSTVNSGEPHSRLLHRNPRGKATHRIRDDDLLFLRRQHWWLSSSRLAGARPTDEEVEDEGRIVVTADASSVRRCRSSWGNLRLLSPGSDVASPRHGCRRCLYLCLPARVTISNREPPRFEMHTPLGGLRCPDSGLTRHREVASTPILLTGGSAGTGRDRRLVCRGTLRAMETIVWALHHCVRLRLLLPTAPSPPIPAPPCSFPPLGDESQML